ncbi:MAG: hypothetical protein QF471_08935, partial [Phycisphaerales bacterium]|nr:hypothetical protein [Phycisphaerales bacterium]
TGSVPSGGSGDVSELLLTFRYKRDNFPENDSGILATYAGLSFNGFYTVSIYDVQDGRWREFQGQTLPVADGTYTAMPYPGAPDNFFFRYGQLDDGCPDWYEVQVRINVRSFADVGSFQWDLNRVDISPLADPGGP